MILLCTKEGQYTADCRSCLNSLYAPTPTSNRRDSMRVDAPEAADVKMLWVRVPRVEILEAEL